MPANPQPKTDKLYADWSLQSKQHSDLTAWERLIKYRKQETAGGRRRRRRSGCGGVRLGVNGGDRRRLWVVSALPFRWRASSAEHLAYKQLCPFNERTDKHAYTQHIDTALLHWKMYQTPNKILDTRYCVEISAASWLSLVLTSVWSCHAANIWRCLKSSEANYSFTLSAR